MTSKKDLTIIFVIHLFGINSNAKLIDLTYNLEPNMTHWPTHTNFEFTKQIQKYVDYNGRWYYAYNEFQATEHIGTHFDAFSHFNLNGSSMDLMKTQQFFLNAILIDISEKCEQNRSYTLHEADLNFTSQELAFLKRKNNLLLIRTGFGRYWNDRKAYTGTNVLDINQLDFPGISEEAARKIVKLKTFLVVGIDTLSTDSGKSKDYMVHRIFANNSIYGLENIANLDLLPEHEFFHVYAFPMKIKGATGAPARVVARVFNKQPQNKTNSTNEHVITKATTRTTTVPLKAETTTIALA